MKKGTTIALLSISILSFTSCQMTQEKIKETTQKSCKVMIEKLDAKVIDWVNPSQVSASSQNTSTQQAPSQEPTNIWEAAESGRTW